MNDSSEWSLKPIAFFRNRGSHGARPTKKDLPRQGPLSEQRGVIQLENWVNPPQSLSCIEGFSHLWIIFGFHESRQARTMVRPPKRPDLKVGVYASRAPYRPNGLGLSVVRLETREGHKLYVSQCDLLEDTPVFDIKPYLPEFESHPNALSGWTTENIQGPFSLNVTPQAQEQIDFLREATGVDLGKFASIHLTHYPFPTPSKRIDQLAAQNHFTLAHGQWRIHYLISSTVHPLELQILFIAPAPGFADLKTLADFQKRFHQSSLQSALTCGDVATLF